MGYGENPHKGGKNVMTLKKLKVGFICVHNSCRSQMAEALAKHFASDVFEFFSAGTEKKDKINQDAVSVIKEKYNIDMEKEQYSKLISEIPKLDIVITMGCNVECPSIECKHIEDWGLSDPSGKEREEFYKTAKIIEEKIMDLKKRITNEEIF